MIEWKPIDTMPEDRKDGRPMLIWAGSSPFVADWLVASGEGAWFSIDVFLGNVTHWDDINTPEGEEGRHPRAGYYFTPREANAAGDQGTA